MNKDNLYKILLIFVLSGVAGLFVFFNWRQSQNNFIPAKITAKKFLSSQLDEMHKANEVQIANMNKWLALLSEEEASRHRKEIDRIKAWKERCKEDMKKFVQMTLTTTQAQLREQFLKEVTAEYEKIKESMFKALKGKLVAIRNEDVLKRKEAVEQHKTEKEKVVQEQMKIFETKLTTTFARVENKINEDLKKLADTDKKSRDVLRAEFKKENQYLSKKYLESFNKKLLAACADISQEQRVLLIEQSKMFDSKLFGIQDKVQKEAEKRISAVIASKKSEWKVEKKKRIDDLEIMNKKYFSLFDKKLSLAKHEFQCEVRDRLKQISDREEEKRIKSQESLIVSYKNSFDKQLMNTKKQIERKAEEILSDLILKGDRKMLVFDEKISKVKQKIDDTFRIQLDSHKKEIDKEKDLVKKYLDSLVKKQNSVLNEQLLGIVRDMKMQAAKQISTLAKNEESLRRRENNEFEKKRTELFDKKLALIQIGMKNRLEKELYAVSMQMQKDGESRIEKEKLNHKEFAKKCLNDFNKQLVVAKKQLTLHAKEQLGELAKIEREKRLKLFNDELEEVGVQAQEKVYSKLKKDFDDLSRAEGEKRLLAEKMNIEVVKGLAEKQKNIFDTKLSVVEQKMREELDKKIDVLSKKEQENLDTTRKERLALFEVELNRIEERLRLEGENKLKETVSLQDEKRRHDNELLAKRQMERFQEKISVVKDALENKATSELRSTLNKIEDIGRSIREEQKVQISGLKEAQKEYKDTIAKSQEEQKKILAKEQEEFAKKYLEKLNDQLVATREGLKNQVRHQFKILAKSALMQRGRELSESFRQVTRKIDNEFEPFVARDSYKKRELEELAGNMIKMLESRLSTTAVRPGRAESRRFNSFVEKLRKMSRTHNNQLKYLDEKLERIKQEKMSARKEKHENEITQNEVDNIVKREVRKQLSSLRRKRDPRVTRLRKIVALEKMRRLVKGLVDGDADEYAIDF
jgi:hypothetical protein